MLCTQSAHTSAKGIHFHSALGFATQTLAYMLDSLVRVSRRVELQDRVKLQEIFDASLVTSVLPGPTLQARHEHLVFS